MSQPIPPTALTDFAPYQALAARLLAVVEQASDDGSHDLSHIARVWRNASEIAATEPGCDTELLAAAVLLHDCVAVEKNAPLRSQASRLAAERARVIMAAFDWTSQRIDRLAHAIEAHSFSAGIPPETLEARILRDADRLDAIGAVGIARCFYVGGRMGSALYDAADLDARDRALDDRSFAYDHFAAKLLRLGSGFLTAAGRTAAAERMAIMDDFIRAFRAEIVGPRVGPPA